MPEFAATIDLSALDGANGFRLASGAGEWNGSAVASAGDINGDGFDDVLIFEYSPNGDNSRCYVVFGKASSFGPSLDLASLDGKNGFRFEGEDISLGRALVLVGAVATAGDVNGDGFDDFIVGSVYANPDGLFDAGESYVVFGKASGFGPTLNFASLDGTNGFQLEGINARDYSGQSVASAGDVNGDGFADIVIGAPHPDQYDGGPYAGESYVVFGKASGFDAVFGLAGLDGTNGFRIDGIDAGDGSGYSVASAGDVNGDGLADMVVGAPGADESYVIFGKASGFGAALDLAGLDGTNGFRLDGGGRSVASAGDVNADGFADIIVGDIGAAPGGDVEAGASYVVFGKASGFGPSLDLASLYGTNGFRLDGIDANDRSGWSVASAGDVNGDGFADIVIGAYTADPGGDANAGESYVVFGKASGFGAALDLASLDGTNGFRLDGVDAGDNSGDAVASAGDINGDGFADLVIGAPAAATLRGESYVIFGHEALEAVTRVGTAIANRINGGIGDDSISGLGGDDTLLGRGGDDTIDGGAGNDTADYSGALGGGVTVNLKSAAQAVGADQGIDTLLGIENITGSAQGDRLIGNAGANVLAGLAGSDVLIGGNGADTLDGGAGNDTADYSGALGGGVKVNLKVIAQAVGADQGIDTLLDIENITGSAQGDQLFGNSRANILSGNAGDDLLNGGNGDDTMRGGEGSDRFIDVSGGGDNFSGGDGTDTADFRTSATGAILNFISNVHGGAAAGDSFTSIEKFLGSDTAKDTMTGGGGRVVFAGGGGNDVLSGGAKNDQLLGQVGQDTLIGGADSDALDGGTGNDTMTGGGEGDVFVFVDAGFGQDTITDYQDGLDRFKVFSAVADTVTDFTIANNGTTSVTLTLGANTITVNGVAAITIAADDFVFY